MGAIWLQPVHSLLPTSTLTPSHSQPPPFSLFSSKARLSLHLIFLRSFLVPNLHLPSIYIPVPSFPHSPSNICTITVFPPHPLQLRPSFSKRLLADTRTIPRSQHRRRTSPFFDLSNPCRHRPVHAHLSSPRKAALVKKYGTTKTQSDHESHFNKNTRKDL